MIVTNLDGLDLTALDVTATLTNKSGPLEFDNRRRARTDAQAYVATSLRPGVWDVNVQCPSRSARDRVLAMLQGERTRELVLTSAIDGVGVTAQAAVRRIDPHDNGQDVRVTFEPTWPVWTASDPDVVSDTLTTEGTLIATVEGNRPIAPVVTIQPTVQRASATALVGWKWRRRFAVTNNSDEGWYRFPIRISLGSTTEAVSGGKALASGDDVRVWFEGRELPRTLIGWNSGASYAWVLVPSLGAGKTASFDVVYGNASATAPTPLAYPDLPAFDLTASSNSLWRYLYQAGSGAWFLSSATTPPVVDQEVPGSWRSLITLDNPDNVDDVNQVRAYPIAGGYYAIFAAMRGVSGSLALADEGLADGIALHHPCGITAVSANVTYRNDRFGDAGSVALGKFVVLTRNSGAMGWDKLYENSTVVHATYVALGRIAYTPAGAVKHVAFAVWPFNEIEVLEGTYPGHVIHCLWNDYVDVSVDGSKIAISEVGGETEVYELATVITVGASVLRLGAATAGARAAVELDQVVVVDAETRTAQVWDSTRSTKVGDLPIYAVQARTVKEVLGGQVERPASDWLLLRPDPAGAAVTVSEDSMGTLAVSVETRPAWVQ